MKRLLILLLLLGRIFAQNNNARMLNGVNSQTGTSYAFVAADSTRLTTFSNAATTNATLASNLNGGSGNVFTVLNLGPGSVVITCQACVFFSSNASGSSTYTLSIGQGADIYAAGINYYVQAGAGSLPNPAVFPGPIVSQAITSTGPAIFGPCSQITNAPCVSAIQFNGPDPYGMAGPYDQLEDVVDPATGESALCFNYSGLYCARLWMTGWQSTAYTDGNIWGYNASAGIPTVVPNVSFNSQTGALTVPSCTGCGTLPGLTQGNPVTTNASGSLAPSPAIVFADQFAGADWCAKVNAAYLALPATGGVIDARGFKVAQPCNSNPYHGANKTVRLLLPTVPIVTSVPWFTPQNPNVLEGTTDGNSASTGGSVIQACGTGGGCTVAGVSVPQFPNATNQLTFHNVAHGPFPTGTYACIVCGGGQGSSETQGWNNDSFGQVVVHVKLDAGTNTNIFGYYSANAEERSYLDDVHCGGFGVATNSACVFYDRTEAVTGQSGPSHFSVGNVHVNFNNSASSTSAWGFVFALNNAICQLSGGGGSGATCYVDKISAGTPHVSVGYPGTGYSSAPTWTVYGAPASTFGGTQISDCTGTVTLNGTAVATMGSQCAAVDYGNGYIAEGPEDFHGTAQGNGANNIAGGVYLAAQNANISYLHCERMTGGACLQFGNGSDLSSSGFFHTIDGTSTVTEDLIHVEAGNDCQSNFYALQFTSVTGTPNLMHDDCLINAQVGSSITITTAQANGFGTVKNLEFYSGGGALSNYGGIAFPYKATSALTLGQIVKIDSANANSVVTTVTTDTAAGIPIGVVLNAPAAGSYAFVGTIGTTSTPILGTGTCSIGNFVIVDTTTNGRVKCTGTYSAGTVIGYATAAQASVGSPVTMLIQLK